MPVLCRFSCVFFFCWREAWIYFAAAARGGAHRLVRISTSLPYSVQYPVKQWRLRIEDCRQEAGGVQEECRRQVHAETHAECRYTENYTEYYSLCSV